MNKLYTSTVITRQVTSIDYGDLAKIIASLDMDPTVFGIYYDKIREEIANINPGELNVEYIERTTDTLNFIKNLIVLQNNLNSSTDNLPNKLRHLQKLAITGFINFLIWSFERGQKTGYIVIPTGQGKTYLSLIIALQNTKKTIIIANDNVGVHQYHQDALKIGIEHAQITTEETNNKKVIIGTWQSFANAQQSGKIDLKEYSVIFVDEADVNGLSNKRQELLDEITLQYQTSIIGLSATEQQASKKQLSDFYIYDVLRFPMPGSLPELHKIEELPNAHFSDIILDSDLYTSPSEGDIADSDVDTFIKTSRWIEQILDYHNTNNKGKKFILGMRNNKLNDNIVRIGKSVGLTIIGLTGELGQSERTKIINQLRNGEIDGIVGSRLSGRGLDIPECDVVYNSLLTYSPQLFWQLAGRGIRIDPTHEGKQSELVTFLPQRVYTTEQYQGEDNENGEETQKDEKKQYAYPLCFGAFFQKNYFAVNGESIKGNQEYSLSNLSEEEMRTIDEVTLYLMGIRKYGYYMGRPEILTSIIRHTKGSINMSRLLHYHLQLKGKRVDEYIRNEGEINKEDEREYETIRTQYQKGNHESLTISREKNLFEEYTSTSDETIKKKIVEEILHHHYPIIIALAQKFKTESLSTEDLTQAGALFVLEKFESFKPFSRFSSFCAVHALAGILKYKSNKDSLIYSPVYRQELLTKIQRILDTMELPKRSEIIEVIERVGGKIRNKGEIVQKKIDQILSEINQEYVEWDELIHTDTLITDPDPTYTEFKSRKLTALLRIILQEQLTRIETQNLNLKIHDDLGHTEIGQKLERSRESIKQIEWNSIRKLKHPDTSDILRQFIGDDHPAISEEALQEHFNQKRVQEREKQEEQQRLVLAQEHVDQIIEQDLTNEKIAQYLETSIDVVRIYFTRIQKINLLKTAGYNTAIALEEIDQNLFNRRKEVIVEFLDGTSDEKLIKAGIIKPEDVKTESWIHEWRIKTINENKWKKPNDTIRIVMNSIRREYRRRHTFASVTLNTTPTQGETQSSQKMDTESMRINPPNWSNETHEAIEIGKTNDKPRYKLVRILTPIDTSRNGIAPNC